MMHALNMRYRATQGGLSLAELLVAVAISLLVLTALSAVFLSTTKARNEMQKSTQQQESGRYASQLLSDNLKLAGYFAEFDTTPLTTPALLPDPCAEDRADLLTAMPLHIQGVNDDGAAPSCLTDVKSGTDIVVVRRVASCAIDDTGCAGFAAGNYHFQASLCTPDDGSGGELAHAISTDADYADYHFKLSSSLGDFTLRKTSCNATDIADINRYVVHIYYIANNNNAGDGIPTLKRAELGASQFDVVPLVDGVENMQIEYGIDTTGDGIPESYVASPADTAAWRNAMSARIHLLTRNTLATQGYVDTKTYVMGDKTVAAPGDNFKRHVYSTTVQFVNPSWRRQ
jgi:type IV pilus assembly protein PilW